MSPIPSSVSPSIGLSDEQTLEAAQACLIEYIPLPINDSDDLKTLLSVLLRAASRQDSIEHTSTLLIGVPCGNDIRYHLHKLDNMAALEEQLNAALQSQMPPSIVNHRQRLAIDFNLLPYYGKSTEQSADYLYRSQAKAGTTTFFAYATIYVIRDHQRVTLAIHPIPYWETAVATITYLLAQLTAIHVKIKRLYLDRGFYSVPVIRWLKALKIPFIMPAVIRGKQGGTRALCKGYSRYQDYTLNSQQYGSVTCRMAVVCSYHQGRKGKHGRRYQLYVVYRVKVAVHQVPNHYCQRFGIETSYRLKNQCRIRTSTRNPVLRLLFVALAFILVNVWLTLLWYRLSRTRQGARRVYSELFPLKTMLEFICHAIERRFPVKQEILIPLC